MYFTTKAHQFKMSCKSVQRFPDSVGRANGSRVNK